ncbi:cobalt-zinc-cadmium efflux system membrane fusion protein [Pedobacter nutrimenti]|uniref:Cobalt-zinc-cadmium efflux system membrane fusion protein n=2 Tax=Pedobacter nutrimenti TaxID=1241337 RepID=A0A318U7I7_9SPHI|nr:cobalt-zinc-cadmium efflux system membrane fusion protein [Pedobacter nutrimenti]
MKKIQFSSFLYVLFPLTVLLSSCGGEKKESKTETAAVPVKEDDNAVELSAGQYKTSGITLGILEKKPISGVLKVNGFIDVPPENLISITTQMGGIVKSTPLLQGSLVSKGQVIAVLQNQDYVQLQQDYLENRSQLELADAEYKRQQELSRQNINAQKVLQQARSQYQTMLARSSALQQRLQLINISPAGLTAGNIRSTINIYAPVTGYVTKVNVNTGKFVTPNDVMFEIVNSANLHVELKVFQKDAELVKKGQKVRFSLSNDPEERMATVTLVGREINQDKTVTVHCISNSRSGSLLPGAYLQAFIETGSNKVDALPESAVVDFEGKKYIFIQTAANRSEKNIPAGQPASYHFQKIAVKTGAAEAGYVEIELPDGIDLSKAQIVTKGAYDLISKMKNSEEE